MNAVLLVDVCHARAGDKGDSALLVLVPYRQEDYLALIEAVSPPGIAEHFHVPVDDVSVIPAAGLSALVIAVRHRLYGGVTRSLTIDPHGKTLSGHLLDMVVEWPRQIDPTESLGATTKRGGII